MEEDQFNILNKKLDEINDKLDYTIGNLQYNCDCFNGGDDERDFNLLMDMKDDSFFSQFVITDEDTLRVNGENIDKYLQQDMDWKSKENTTWGETMSVLCQTAIRRGDIDSEDPIALEVFDMEREMKESLEEDEDEDFDEDFEEDDEDEDN
jgi:hypothetical protein